MAEKIVNPFLYDEEKSGKRIKKKVSNALKSNEDLIIHPSKSGTEYLGHEIGHIENSKTSNPIKKFINKIANDPKTRDDINTSAILRLKDEGLGFKEAGKRFIKGNLVLAEEKNASKNSLRKLKKYGANKEDLKKSKENLKIGEDTYKDIVSSYYKVPLSNLIHTPGRRSGVGYEKRMKRSLK